jgi:hypothetical protein
MQDIYILCQSNVMYLMNFFFLTFSYVVNNMNVPVVRLVRSINNSINMVKTNYIVTINFKFGKNGITLISHLRMKKKSYIKTFLFIFIRVL